MGKRTAARKAEDKAKGLLPVQERQRRLPLLVRRHALFLGLLGFAAASRFVILFASQTHVHSDEAIIGLMAKHISEGRYYPFYMYGQPYNAGASCEAYLASIPFAVFGVGVLPLKCCVVLSSLLCLTLFYLVVSRIYDRRTAFLAALVLALFPSLVKWHFQVRGYSPYFLSFPILLGLFWSIDSSARRRGPKALVFGLASGLSVLCLELSLFPVVALWALLAVRRRFTARTAALGLMGCAIGYAPAAVYNLTHQFSNWREVFIDKTGSDVRSLLAPATYVQIFVEEMPKFFGPDTVLWYYPEKPLAGYVFYAFAVAAIVVAIAPFVKAPKRIGKAILDGSSAMDVDLVLLLLTFVCFVPYLVAWLRTPSYFFGGCFFLSMLMGRLLGRCFAAASWERALGAAVVVVVLIAGLGVLVNVGRQNEIETLTYNENGQLHMTRVPAHDLEALEHDLIRKKASSVWATVSFVYPLIFESDEKLAVSDAIFGTYRPIYPASVPQRLPRPNEVTAFVTELSSPAQRSVEGGFAQVRRKKPETAEFGMFTVIYASPGTR
jgi:4-amino-4-deoxy-L-arabinose transferase-like glycosyltransferase